MTDIEVDTAQVRRSADEMHVVAQEASTSRSRMAASISGQTAAWKQAGTPGFSKFIGILEAQAERLRSDLTGLGDTLRTAADVYDRQDDEGGQALDSTAGGTG